MDLPLATALGTAAFTGAAAIGMSIYALILRNRTARAETARDVATGKESLAEAKAAGAITKLANAEATIKRLEAALKTVRAERQKEKADHAERGDPGGGDAVDDILARLHPDADGDALRAGRDASGRVPGDGAGTATAAGEIDVPE